jgi:hypothetical protein
VKVLKLSDGAAYRRIQAVRLSASIPEVRDQVRQGEIPLTNAAKLQSYFEGEERNGKRGHNNTRVERFGAPSARASARKLSREGETALRKRPENGGHPDHSRSQEQGCFDLVFK